MPRPERGVCRGAVRDSAGVVVAPVRVRIKQGAVYQCMYTTEDSTACNTQLDFANGFYTFWADVGAYTIEFYKQTGGVWETTPFLTIDNWQVFPRADYSVATHVARTIVARHTFNPTTVGPPFYIGSNAYNQMVAGLNAEFVGGYRADDIRPAYIVEADRITATQSIPANTWTTLVFNRENRDTYNAYNPATGRFTAPASRLYLFVLFLGFEGAVDPNFTIWLRGLKNGMSEQVFFNRNYTMTTYTNATISCACPCTINDTHGCSLNDTHSCTLNDTHACQDLCIQGQCNFVGTASCLLSGSAGCTLTGNVWVTNNTCSGQSNHQHGVPWDVRWQSYSFLIDMNQGDYLDIQAHVGASINLSIGSTLRIVRLSLL